MSLPAPLVPVSWGELLDKIAILGIKAERIADPGKRANVRRELDALCHARDTALATAYRGATRDGTACGGAVRCRVGDDPGGSCSSGRPKSGGEVG